MMRTMNLISPPEALQLNDPHPNLAPPGDGTVFCDGLGVARQEECVSITVTKTGAALGARIDGVDLRKPLDDATFAAIRAAFYEHEVVYFRGTELSDEDHIRFSARFGELRRIKLDQVHGRHPELFV